MRGFIHSILHILAVAAAAAALALRALLSYLQEYIGYLQAVYSSSMGIAGTSAAAVAFTNTESSCFHHQQKQTMPNVKQMTVLFCIGCDPAKKFNWPEPTPLLQPILFMRMSIYNTQHTADILDPAKEPSNRLLRGGWCRSDSTATAVAAAVPYYIHPRGSFRDTEHVCGHTSSKSRYVSCNTNFQKRKEEGVQLCFCCIIYIIVCTYRSAVTHFRISAETPGRPGSRRLGVLVFCESVL